MRAVRTAALAGIAIVLLVVGGAMIALRTGTAHDWLVSQIDTALGPRVRIADANFTFWPPPIAVAVEQVRLLPAAPAPDSAPLASAARVTIDLSVDDLLARKLVVDALAIDGAVLTVEPGPGGTLQVAGLDALPAGADTSPGALPQRLPEITVRDASLTVQPRPDPATALAFTAVQGTLSPRADGLDFTLSATLPDGGALRATGRTGTLVEPLAAMPLTADVEIEKLDGAALARRIPAAGGLDVRGTGRATLALSGTVGAPTATLSIDLPDGAIAMQGWSAAAPLHAGAAVAWTAADGFAATGGQVTAARLAYGNAVADQPRASFEYRAGALALTGASFTACGGTWQQSGRVTLAEPIAMDATLQTSGVDAQQLVAAFPAFGLAVPAPSGSAPVDIAAKLTGTVGDSLSGHFRLALGAGALAWEQARLTAPAHVEADVTTTGSSLQLDNGSLAAAGVTAATLSIANPDLRFALADRVLRLPPSRLRVANADWTIEGSARLDDIGSWNATINAKQIDLDALLAAIPNRDASDPSAPGGVADLDLTVAGAAGQSPSGRGTLDLHAGTFAVDALRVTAPARLTSEFALHNGDLALRNADAQAARATYGPLVADRATGTFTLAEDRLTFSTLRFTSCGGAWTHSGDYVLSEGGAFGGKLGIAGADPRALLEMLKLGSDGVHIQRLDAQADFKGDATPGWLDHLTANGTLSVSGGSIRHGAVLTALWDALIRRDRSQAPTRENRIDHAGGTFALANGVCQASNLTLQSEDYSLAGGGTIRLDGQLNLDTTITLTAAGVQHLIALGSVPLPTTMLPSLPPIPTSITGPADDMIVRPDVSGVPLATAGWLVKSVVGAPAAVGGAVVDGVGDLFRGAERLIDRGKTPQR